MATENKKNNTEQTLFRFVSLRNPQLTETKAKNLGFIHRQVEAKGFFDDKLTNITDQSANAKFSELEKYVGEFVETSNVFTNESELETDFPNLLKAGRKISKREVLNDDDILEISLRYNLLFTNNTDGYESLKMLWDNLIYQILTQKDFYIKESIIHILKALHYGYAKTLSATEEMVKINGDDLLRKSLEGKVVLPVSLFGDGSGTESSTSTTAGNPFQVNVSNIGEGIINGTQLSVATQQQLKVEGEKISELSFLELEKNEFVQLKSELEKIQKAFYKLRAKQYDAAYKDYQDLYQATLDEYNIALERIDAQIHEGMSQEEIDALYAELGELNVPPFKFDYKNELNFEDLKSKLSQELFTLFIENFTIVNNGSPVEKDLDYSQIEIVSDKELLINEISVSITEDYDTFPEVFEKLDDEIKFKTQKLFAKSPATGQEFAKIGNVLVPVNKTTYTEISGTYYLKVITKRVLILPNNYLTFFYNTDNSSLGLLSASLEMTGNGQGIYKNIPSIDVVDGKVIFPLIIGYLKSVSKVKITLYFKNGEYTTIEQDNVVSDQTYTGRFAFRTKVDDDIDETPGGGTENPGEGGGSGNPGGTTNPQTGSFTRKNFGIKRLGVADYMKVVQSTHAYVPGEVTHIENIMAKEFKQKSSRKLRRSEIQTTTSKSTERENLNDTTSTTRNDMQSEVANIIQQDISAEAHFRYGGGKTVPYEIGGSFATNNSKENSTRQAIAKSQEITEKATERLLTKVAEERIEKIIEEFEENNAHGYDNREGDKHVVGVYRWVDKKMKNQIYNYGIRTMFEFMIPEPAKLHRLATFATRETIKEPVDPRKASSPNTMPDAKSANEILLKYWADYYGVTLTPLPQASKMIVENKTEGGIGNGTRTASFVIPQDYSCERIEGPVHCESGKKLLKNTKIWIYHPINGGEIHYSKNKDSDLSPVTGLNITNTLNLNIKGNDLASVTIQLRMYLKLSNDFINAWKQENFEAIIKAYETAYQDFLAKQKEADEKAKEEEAENKEKMSNFYRDMERVIIKHNCIAYLLQDYLNNKTLGNTELTNKAQAMKDFSIILDENLDQYTALAKFLEQAFEWTIMDYTFYPYYWASRDEWQNMYLSESTDPLFRSFLQAGMARVVVTVNPGFEDAVQFFMATGKVWNGGEIPVIGDPMYMSIVDEMREPLGKKQGKAWITTLPTSLNILQKDSVGLITTTALPFSEENPEEFEVPSDVVTDDSDFQPNNNLLGVKSDDTSEKIISGDWD
ncbi:hypothetical protein NZ698_10970 [Chryseobacterium sp. PBS4-4]|uniref:Uncharacterized protein n=1 Tax=Chryseobacterium edaphi TaxID=2976532 RepID=A0ABT2WAS6_9FLAO|nr:hypothetical protein [Chryseobacterium edaphi]MCU7617720.1 hypothetical protein [Chryseobacterium edaphi]